MTKRRGFDSQKTLWLTACSKSKDDPRDRSAILSDTNLFDEGITDRQREVLDAAEPAAKPRILEVNKEAVRARQLFEAVADFVVDLDYDPDVVFVSPKPDILDSCRAASFPRRRRFVPNGRRPDWACLDGPRNRWRRGLIRLRCFRRLGGARQLGENGFRAPARFYLSQRSAGPFLVLAAGIFADQKTVGVTCLREIPFRTETLRGLNVELRLGEKAVIAVAAGGIAEADFAESLRDQNVLLFAQLLRGYGAQIVEQERGVLVVSLGLLRCFRAAERKNAQRRQGQASDESRGRSPPAPAPLSRKGHYPNLIPFRNESDLTALRKRLCEAVFPNCHRLHRRRRNLCRALGIGLPA